MRIIPDTIREGQVTILIGHLPDQAALSGVLNTLYERRVPLLSVENLDEKGGDS
jgi:cytochrome c-type biogenesis protein CcmE